MGPSGRWLGLPRLRKVRIVALQEELLQGISFLLAVCNGISAKQKGNTPKACQTYDRIDNAAEQGTLSPKEPCDQIKLKDTNQSPVQTADD